MLDGDSNIVDIAQGIASSFGPSFKSVSSEIEVTGSANIIELLQTGDSLSASQIYTVGNSNSVSVTQQ